MGVVCRFRGLTKSEGYQNQSPSSLLHLLPLFTSPSLPPCLTPGKLSFWHSYDLFTLGLSPPPTLPTPFPFSLIFHRETTPTAHLTRPQNPFPKDTDRNSRPFAKTTPGKDYPLVCVRILFESTVPEERTNSLSLWANWVSSAKNSVSSFLHTQII